MYYTLFQRSGMFQSQILRKLIQENCHNNLGCAINRGLKHTSRRLNLKCGSYSSFNSVQYLPYSNLLYRQCQPGIQQYRNYRTPRSRGTQNESDVDATPALMDFPWIIWPNIFNTLKNWVFVNLLIKPYFDIEFSLKGFKEGSRQALVAVSQELSHGNFEGLDSFVTMDALGVLKRSFSALSIKQRMDIAVASEDIFFSFPHEIGVIFKNEGSQKEQIFIEITMCFHVFRGFEDHIKRQSNLNETAGIKSVYSNMDQISIANYRFIREFTKGVEDEWTVNLLNHFKPGEHLQKK